MTPKFNPPSPGALLLFRFKEQLAFPVPAHYCIWDSVGNLVLGLDLGSKDVCRDSGLRVSVVCAASSQVVGVSLSSFVLSQFL